MKQKTIRQLHSSQKNAMLRARNRDQIRSYFEQVLNLRNSGEAYPVKLDDVWPLVYIRKDAAVETLKTEFYEGIDYVMQRADNQFFRQKRGKLSHTPGRPMETYFLSSSCLEYFIARRVPEVFEVYRKVFHLSIDACTPIAGVFPVLYQGKVYYPYTPLLKAVGYSTRSGSVQSRRRQYPQQFVKYADRNWITPDMANLLVRRHEALVLQQELKKAQLALPFKEETVGEADFSRQY
ncbi:MAG: hypothetical protein HUK10_03635 [Bacteroides heparinolyticus]|nr:hypothetical protein [Bacteroides heparinolyticus]